MTETDRRVGAGRHLTALWRERTNGEACACGMFEALSGHDEYVGR